MRAIAALVLAPLIAGCSTNPPPPAPQPVAAPHPNSLAAQMAATWRHVPGPVSEQKSKQDQAKCRMMGQMAPVGAGTPEIKAMVIFIDCMKAEGYEPIQ